MIYVLNTLIIPVDFEIKEKYEIYLEKINIETAKKILSEGFTSAIGHESTARLLTKLLKIEIPFNRIAIKMREGDIGIHFFLKTRLPEGKILSEFLIHRVELKETAIQQE